MTCGMHCSLTNAGIPSSLTRLSHLKAIGLKKNNLTQVPPVLGAIRSLQEIYLENNPALEVRGLDLLAPPLADIAVPILKLTSSL